MKKHFLKSNMKMLFAGVIFFIGVAFLYNYAPTAARMEISSTDDINPVFEAYRKGISQSLPETIGTSQNSKRVVVIEETDGKISLIIKALQDANIHINLRGPFVTDEYGNRLEKWVTYTSFVIDDQPIIDENVKVWFGESFEYVLSAKKGKSYVVELAWHR